MEVLNCHVTFDFDKNDPRNKEFFETYSDLTLLLWKIMNTTIPLEFGQTYNVVITKVEPKLDKEALLKWIDDRLGEAYQAMELNKNKHNSSFNYSSGQADVLVALKKFLFRI